MPAFRQATINIFEFQKYFSIFDKYLLFTNKYLFIFASSFKNITMKTRTEKILVALRILAFMGAVKYSIDGGAQLTSFVASFINPEWAKRTYQVNLDIFSI